MQAAIVVLSSYILVSIIKRKSQSAVPIYEYEERRSQAVDKNQKRNKESDFSSYK
jgi:hypothetical protein